MPPPAASLLRSFARTPRQCLSIEVVAGVSRADLLRRGGRGGAALVLAGPALALAPAEAQAATPSDNDLTYARLFVACELLACDFYRRAVGSWRSGSRNLEALRRSLYDERKHLRVVGEILLEAGQTPAKPGDIDFIYPARAFASRGAIAALGARLETLFRGAYLGAVAGFDADELKALAARIAASEAQHLSVIAAEAGGERIGAAFPRPLTIDEASDQLDRFTA
jgi:hypothetical protein